MELIGQPDGRPGQHLGVSHMLKHYLCPAEVWEDLVPDDVPHRPWRMLDELAQLTPPAWRQWRRPGEQLTAQWDTELVPAYRQGYLEVVRRMVAPFRDLRAAEWRRCLDGCSACATEDGVVIIVAENRRGPTLRTAFRPLGFTLRSHESVPLNAANRKLRRVIAHKKAAQRVRLIACGGGP